MGGIRATTHVFGTRLGKAIIFGEKFPGENKHFGGEEFGPE